jgi:hypothetical protein
MHGINRTTPLPLNELPFDTLCPGAKSLASLQDLYR